jgi:ribosomal protein L7/L12
LSRYLDCYFKEAIEKGDAEGMKKKLQKSVKVNNERKRNVAEILH